MKSKQSYQLRGSFALLLFVILGYVVKFYPEQLTSFDSSLQASLRGNLPSLATSLFRAVTVLCNPWVITVWGGSLVLFFSFVKKWRLEALFLLINLVGAGLLVKLIKPLYARPRPSISHLVTETGFSFPSGHSLAATLVFGTLIILVQQRVQHQVFKRFLQIVLAGLIATILLSRVYLGVHYPSDVTAGFLFGFGLLQLEFPFYDEWRFKARFQGKQP